MLQWEDAEAPVVLLGRPDVPPLRPRHLGEMKNENRSCRDLGHAASGHVPNVP